MIRNEGMQNYPTAHPLDDHPTHLRESPTLILFSCLACSRFQVQAKFDKLWFLFNAAL
jgi:hypothetical protein